MTRRHLQQALLLAPDLSDPSMGRDSCSRCGGILSPDAPERLCPECAPKSVITPVSVLTSKDPTSLARIPSVDAVTREPLLKAGGQFGPNRIERLLGRGGMAEVYEAEHVENGHRLARTFAESNDAVTSGGPDPDDLRWLFRARQAVDCGDLRDLSVADLDRFRDARHRWRTAPIVRLYGAWQRDGDAVLTASDALGDL
jgi:hypothetical protein